jgi:hypothetical protein
MDWAIVKSGGPYGTGNITERADVIGWCVFRGGDGWAMLDMGDEPVMLMQN